MTLPASSLIGEIVRDNQDALTVGPQALGLKMLDPLPGFQAGNDVVFLRDAFGGDDNRNMASHHLLGGVAEETLGSSVPALNDTVQRLADDGVIRGFDDRREQPRRQQLAGLVLLHASLHGDVAKNQDASGHLAPFVHDRCGAVINRALAAVPANQHRVIRQADDDSLPQGPCRRVHDRPTGFLVDDPKHRLEWLVRGLPLHPTRQGFGDRIQVGDVTVDVGCDDRVADTAQRDS